MGFYKLFLIIVNANKYKFSIVSPEVMSKAV